MKLLLTALLLLSAFAPACSQADTTHWSVEGSIDQFTTDEIGNLYLLRGNDLDLYDEHGRHAAHNSYNAFGPISRIDAFSSLKPMIFSRLQGQLALLDNTLSIQGSPIDLPRRGFPQVTMACMGVQGRFWFFDERDMTLSRLDDKLRPLANTGRLDQLLNFAPQPTYMEEQDDRLYMVDPEHGVLVFDLFGTFMRTLPILGVKEIQVREGSIWYVKDSRLERYDMRAFTTDVIPWPATTTTDTLPVLGARMEHGRIYRMLPDRVLVDGIGQ